LYSRHDSHRYDGRREPTSENQPENDRADESPVGDGRAEEMVKLLDEDFPKAEKVVLICDNLNTHTAVPFYKAFSPKRARDYVNRLKIHCTPES
jgi:hypothetical protein